MNEHKIKPFVFLLFISVLFASSNSAGGAVWTSLEGPYGGYDIKLAISQSNPDVIYAGTKYGGIYISEDGGSSWGKRGIFEPKSFLSIQVAPDNPDIVYAGTINGIYKSEDGGISWTQKGLAGTSVTAIAIDPFNSQILYITRRIPGSSLYDALYKSTDGGETAQSLLSAERGEAVHSILIDTDNPSYIYLGLQTSTDSGMNFLKSTDGGDTWNIDIIIGPDFQNDVVALAMTLAGSSDPAIYAIVQGDDVYKSTDQGGTWMPTNIPLISSDCISYNRCNLAVDYNDSRVVYVSTSEKIYKTMDAGDNWLEKTKAFPDDLASIVIDPGNSNVYVGLYSGGIYKSTEGADSWIFSSKGLNATTIRDIAIDPQSSNTIFSTVGGAGHYLAKTTNNGASWDYLWGTPDNLRVVAIDPQKSSNILVGGIYPDGVYRSWDGGETWINDRKFIGVADIWINPIDPSVSVVATDFGYERCYPDGWCEGYEYGLYWTLGYGVLWEQVDNMTKYTAIAADPNNITTLYLGTKENGYVYKYPGGGYTLSLFSPGGIWVNEVIDIEVDLNSHVYAITDQGLMKLEGYNMSRKLTGLPTDDILAIAIDISKSPGNVYVGTWGFGIYVSNDGGNTWTPFNEGLNNYYITKLAMSTASPRILYAGTGYGGVWSRVVEELPYSDGDGYDDQSELAALSNPNDPDSIPGITTLSLKEGFNLVTIPAETLYLNSSFDFMETHGGSAVFSRILIFDPVTQQYHESGYDETGRLTGENVEFTAGGTYNGMIIYAVKDEELAFTSRYCRRLNLKKGINLIGTACPTEGLSSHQLLQSIGDETLVSGIQRFNAQSGACETTNYQNGQPAGMDFQIKAGEGYIIYMQQERQGFKL